MIITCKVENYEVKCSLTYAVGCNPPPPLKQYSPASLNFTLGWNSYVLTHHVVSLNVRSIVFYDVKEKAVNKRLGIVFSEPSLIRFV